MMAHIRCLRVQGRSRTQRNTTNAHEREGTQRSHTRTRASAHKLTRVKAQSTLAHTLPCTITLHASAGFTFASHYSLQAHECEVQLELVLGPQVPAVDCAPGICVPCPAKMPTATAWMFEEYPQASQISAAEKPPTAGIRTNVSDLCLATSRDLGVGAAFCADG